MALMLDKRSVMALERIAESLEWLVAHHKAAYGDIPDSGATRAPAPEPCAKEADNGEGA